MKKYILSILLFVPLGLYAQEIRLDILNVNKYGLTFRNGVKLDLSYQFIYPINKTPKIQQVKDLMILDFFGNDSIMSLDDAVSLYERGIINDYAKQLPNTTHQYHSQYSAVRIINDKVLVLMIQSYIYMGGVHGLEPASYGNYDLENGTKITIDDLFSEQSKSNVLELINKQITTPLLSETWVTDNFMILPKGIKFKFNPYQINSYGAGQIDATIKYSEFKHLLKPEAVRYFINE